jgi:TRAP-type uncharacterized transport system fused permease subunit
VAYIIPFLFVRAPSLLMQGDAAAIVQAVVTGLAGVWMVCAAFAGFALRPINAPMRAGFAIAGFLLFIPAGALPHGYLTDIAGLVLGALLLTREVIALRLLRRPADHAA